MKHSGTISKISKSAITVSLDGHINCEACQVKASCGLSESKHKEIEVERGVEHQNLANNTFQLNERVEVAMQEELGIKAVFWAYVFPFILMISTLVIASFFLNEWMSGLMALGVLIPYFILLKGLNSFFEKTFKISIFKLSI